MLILPPPPLLLLFHCSSFLSDNFKYFISTIQRTDSKNNIHANKSWAKQSPAIKYVILKRTNSKSDIFVLGEWLLTTIFIFSKCNTQLWVWLNKEQCLVGCLCWKKTYFWICHPWVAGFVFRFRLQHQFFLAQL